METILQKICIYVNMCICMYDVYAFVQSDVLNIHSYVSNAGIKYSLHNPGVADTLFQPTEAS